MSTKPRVFICSTIYDFRDLRSALRHYLLSLGFEPVLSEFNDFRGPIDENSYDACTSAISSCQYFILLIGARVGGIYDSDAQISITRHEYQLAYDKLNQGQLKILAFIRGSLWDVKNDRRDLEKYLKDQWQVAKELSDEEISDIASHPSQFTTDAETVFSFVDEVVRKEDMRAAADKGTSRPKGNWIYQFDDFADIVDALRIQLNISSTIGELTALSNLRREIVCNIRLLLEKSKYGISPGHLWVDFLGNYDLSDLEGQTQIPSGKLLHTLVYTLTGFSKSEQLTTRYAHEIIRTGQLQHFDQQSGMIKSTPLGDAVLELVDQIERLKRVDTLIGPQRATLLATYRPQAKSGGTEMVPVSNRYLFMLKSACDRHQDILALSKAIVRAIDGDNGPLKSVLLQPIVPSLQMVEELKRETPSISELENWIKESPNKSSIHGKPRR